MSYNTDLLLFLPTAEEVLTSVKVDDSVEPIRFRTIRSLIDSYEHDMWLEARRQASTKIFELILHDVSKIIKNIQQTSRYDNNGYPLVNYNNLLRKNEYIEFDNVKIYYRDLHLGNCNDLDWMEEHDAFDEYGDIVDPCHPEGEHEFIERPFIKAQKELMNNGRNYYLLDFANQFVNSFDVRLFLRRPTNYGKTWREHGLDLLPEPNKL